MIWNRKTDVYYLPHHNRIKLEQLSYVNARLSITLWGITYFLYPPRAVAEELGRGLISVSAAMAVIGSLIGIFGFVLTSSGNLNRLYQGLILEFSGLLICFGGPFSFFVTSAYLTLHLDEPQGHSFTAISYALCAFIFSRIAIIWRRLKEAG